jgi:hypothetical protein
VYPPDTRDRTTPRPTLAHNIDHERAYGLYVIALCLAALFPGAVVGGALVWSLWRGTRSPIVMRWQMGLLGGASAAALRASLVLGWPLRLLEAAAIPGSVTPVTLSAIFHSLPVETLLGPLLVAVIETGNLAWGRTIQGQEWARYREVAGRKKALERGWPGPAGAAPRAAGDHPAGVIRLGLRPEDGQPFDIGIGEIAHHIFVPGAAGSGKTTTIGRIADGALANGYGVVIVDCKGTGLGGTARMLAAHHSLPFTAVDPLDPDTLGYDPCSGDAASVANKLVGAFTFSGEAEIYKQVAMEAVPIICRAMDGAGMKVTLGGIYDALAKGGMTRLARKNGVDERTRRRLEDLEESGGVGSAGYLGLQRRLGALMEGRFGPLFDKTPSLSWQETLRSPQVTYLSLSATAASEDVELFGRVITQDLKQVCDDRMRAIDRGEDPPPVLIVYDEFAALREATQVVDLLLQARQARAPLLVATQFLPIDIPIRKPVLSAGVLIVHRLEAEDTEIIAKQFGTHTVPMLTAQVDYETGESAKGSVRQVEEFDIHPNVLKQLPVGVAAVLTRGSKRKTLVAVQRTE